MERNKVIYNWAVVVGGEISLYAAPETETQRLVGNLADGKGVITSPIVGRSGGAIMTKSGSEYIISDVNPAYEEKFPDAKKRLLDSLPEK